jgi:acetyltransferase
MRPTASEEQGVTATINFEALVRPRSIAVVGATERPDTWGNWMMRKLLGGDFTGRVYPINPRAQTILGQPAYANVSGVPDAVELAIIAVPAERVFDVIRDCVAKRVPAGLVVTAGFSEALHDGREREREIVDCARAHGMRLVGPNISGLINLHDGLLAHPTERAYLHKTPITFICQGAYAITDIAVHEASARRGFGQFFHTGNEADITLVDFLEYCETDPKTEAICLYIEGLRDGRRFLEVARRMAPHKPIVAFKAGLTPDGSRAAISHTGALAGSADIYRGLFRQAGIIQAPAFELSLNLAHALLEMPSLQRPTIGITTLGGSWGVMLTDALTQRGLRVPELPPALQAAMRRLGMPPRASVRNPVDFGAAAGSIPLAARQQMVEMLMACDALGGVVVHGYGAPGFLAENTGPYDRQRMEEDLAMIRSAHALQKKYGKPLLIMSAMTSQESQVVRDLTAEDIRFQNRLDDAAIILAALYDYATIRRRLE